MSAADGHLLNKLHAPVLLEGCSGPGNFCALFEGWQKVVTALEFSNRPLRHSRRVVQLAGWDSWEGHAQESVVRLGCRVRRLSITTTDSGLL
jgi:hypothetical protein